MIEEEEQSHLFDKNLRQYEDKLVEILLDISKSKRVNPKMSAIAAYLLIHGWLTQKEIKQLTGFSIGTISTYLSVMIGTGNFQKQRIEGTHTFKYSFLGELETLTSRAIEIALNSLESIATFLIKKKEYLKKLVEQTKEGAEHLLLRIEELLRSFEIYRTIFPPEDVPIKEVQKSFSLKSYELLKAEKKEGKEIKFDAEVYVIEDEIINQLLVSPMFSTRDPIFIKILGYFMTRIYLTQETLQKITSVSAGKISEDVNELLEDNLIYKAKISSKGKITYGADSLILLRFARHIIKRMTKWVKELETIKIELETKKLKLENLNGYTQIYKIYDYTLNTILKYTEYIKKMDQVIKF
ncbi:MAG: hypothetical protein ACFFHD_02840 [Promethearchaeota archaeon]